MFCAQANDQQLVVGQGLSAAKGVAAVRSAAKNLQDAENQLVNLITHP
jgi:hypothetical protein